MQTKLAGRVENERAAQAKPGDSLSQESVFSRFCTVSLPSSGAAPLTSATLVNAMRLNYSESWL